MTEPLPRWLSVEAAARYVSMRETVFLRAVASKKLPKPSYAMGKRTPRWDREAIDAKIAGVGSAATMRELVDGVVSTIETQGRARNKTKAA
jgi:predicted DNA-binding transcriptional regulator AlpA